MNTELSTPSHAKLALFWSIIGALTALAVLPYAMALSPLPDDVPFLVVVIAQPLQTAIVVFLGGWLGLRLGSDIGLDSPWARAWVYGRRKPHIPAGRVGGAVGLGAVSGLIVLVLDQFVFGPFMPPLKSDVAPEGVALWKGLLGSLYGGIGEELITRLIVMTIITWLVWRFATARRQPVAPWVYWTGLLAAGVIFGLGHLPAVTALWDLTPLVIIRTVVLNLLPAVIFGNLYWRWGLEYAMVAHFTADIVLRVIGT